MLERPQSWGSTSEYLKAVIPTVSLAIAGIVHDTNDRNDCIKSIIVMLMAGVVHSDPKSRNDNIKSCFKIANYFEHLSNFLHCS